jgi:hypothetical protein
MRGKLSKDCVGGRLEAAGLDVVGLDAVYSAKVIFARGGLAAAGFVGGDLDALGSTPLTSARRDAKKVGFAAVGFAVADFTAVGLAAVNLVAAGLLDALVFLRSTGFSKQSSPDSDCSNGCPGRDPVASFVILTDGVGVAVAG